MVIITNLGQRQKSALNEHLRNSYFSSGLPYNVRKSCKARVGYLFDK